MWDEFIRFWAYQPREPLLFTQPLFWGLFVGFLAVYVLLHRHTGLRLAYVSAFSLFFYYKSSGWYFVLLLVSTAVDYGLGIGIADARRPGVRKALLGVSVVANLGMLAYFKYTNFMGALVAGALGRGFEPWDIFLPWGISFFVFQTMSYSIDVYRGKLAPIRNPLDFLFFVTFFPQLLAGPIVRAYHLAPQIRQAIRVSRRDAGRGLLLIISGLIKKAIISDYISRNFVDRVFDSPTLYSGVENLMAVYGYAMQIYCDFSGYTDIAIGLALLLGYRLPPNFELPYLAMSLQDFWRRWHISLSSWLRDYLYISLGGNRHGGLRTYANLLVTMVLGGLWHGASVVYLLWGLLHGLGLALERLLSGAGRGFANPALRALLLLWGLQLGGALAVVLAQQRALVGPGVAASLHAGNAAAGAGLLGVFLLGRLGDFAVRVFRPEMPWAASRWVATLFTFHAVALAWIPFRAGALQATLPPGQATAEMLMQIFGRFDPGLAGQVLWGYAPVMWLMALGYGLHVMPRRWMRWWHHSFITAPAVVQAAVLALTCWLVLQTRAAELQPFIYFQF